MLQLKKIKKSYTTGDFTQNALQGVDLTFRKNEFVAILGQSGSGKTTLLNIVGGLDRYDSGDLIINDKSTKGFKATDWDAYRNNCVGFIFQSYNLITHISVLHNVEMSMTLSGYGRSERKAKAMEALTRVGLQEHAHKKPNQLSGGQMQRVAIARSLVNDPDIILADEPTGALDSETSVQIMNLIQEIAKDKLVIMVTHNPELAQSYATRIIKLKDGAIENDSNPVNASEEAGGSVAIKKTAMGYLTALNLSFNNIKTKKGRTFLTSFASSIGIIGIALILALSNGFQMEIDSFERESLSQMPIMIGEQAMQMDPAMMEEMHTGASEKGLAKHSTKKEIVPQEDMATSAVHVNKITQEYVDYIENIDADLVGGQSLMKSTGMNVVVKRTSGEYALSMSGVSAIQRQMSAWQPFPDNPKGGAKASVVAANYNVLAGSIDTNEPGLIIQVDANNRLSKIALQTLGLMGDENITFDKIMDVSLKVVANESYYTNRGAVFTMNSNYQDMYENGAGFTVKVKAIIRGKEGKEMMSSGTGILYTGALTEKIISINKDSAIVKAQEASSVNILSGQAFDESLSETSKKNTMAYLGADSLPSMIYVYPKDFEAKDKILAHLDAFNEGKSKEEKVIYTDMAEMISSLSGDIMSAITLVLIAFSSISLIVSSIMIGIITYISVLERTKEIGILRSLGARKRDISRVFNAETMIVGLCSGLLGILIAQLLCIPINIVIEDLSGLANVAILNPVHALIMISISVTLTLIGGFIPAKIASKKDPVEALRSE